MEGKDRRKWGGKAGKKKNKPEEIAGPPGARNDIPWNLRLTEEGRKGGSSTDAILESDPSKRGGGKTWKKGNDEICFPRGD